MTAPLFRASGVLRGNSTTGTLTIPAAVQDGDWGFLTVSNSDGMGAPSIPTGWSQVAQAAHINSKAYFTVFAKQFAAGDAGPAITWAVGSNFGIVGVWYSGANGIGVIGSVTASAAGTTTVANSVTTTSPDNVVLAMATHTAGSAGFAASGTIAPDATVRGTTFSTATFGHSIVVADLTKATAGATNAQTVTWDAAYTGSGAMQLAVLPVPAPQVWVPSTDTGSTTTGWTKTPAGAASIAAVLSDTDATTYIESGDNPNGLVYQSAPFTLSKPADLTSVRVKASGYLASGTTGSRLIQLYQSTTLIKQQTVALTGTNVETVVSLNSTEAGSITVTAGQWANLSVKVTDTAS